jgi:hypothetical protein
LGLFFCSAPKLQNSILPSETVSLILLWTLSSYFLRIAGNHTLYASEYIILIGYTDKLIQEFCQASFFRVWSFRPYKQSEFGLFACHKNKVKKNGRRK